MYQRYLRDWIAERRTEGLADLTDREEILSDSFAIWLDSRSLTKRAAVPARNVDYCDCKEEAVIKPMPTCERCGLPHPSPFQSGWTANAHAVRKQVFMKEIIANTVGLFLAIIGLCTAIMGIWYCLLTLWFLFHFQVTEVIASLFVAGMLIGITMILTKSVEYLLSNNGLQRTQGTRR